MIKARFGGGLAGGAGTGPVDTPARTTAGGVRARGRGGGKA